MSGKERLANFLRALHDVGIIDFDKRLFKHRLKLQKYVYIARKFGFATDYNYSLYIHGPYSSSLAHDYYELNDFKGREPTPLDSRFVKLVKNKSDEWLELAATILMIRGRYENIDDNKLIDLVITVKPFAESAYLMEIVRSLEAHNCLD